MIAPVQLSLVAGQHPPHMDCDGNCTTCAHKTVCNKFTNQCTPIKCADCPSRGTCGQTAPEPNEQNVKVAETLTRFKKVIIVLSGKGGVGKSSVAVQLGFYLSTLCAKFVGLIDVDVCGPSVPTMTSSVGSVIISTENGMIPAQVNDTFQAISIGHMLEQTDDPVILRGPKKHGMIATMLSDVAWSASEQTRANNYLIIDTPPGTSDEHLSVINTIKQCSMLIPEGMQRPEVEGIIVSTPQEVALADIRKELDFCAKIGLLVRGIVLNMSGFVCPRCDKVTWIFGKDSSKAREVCERYRTQLLAQIPLDTKMVQAGEQGVGYGELGPDDDSCVLDAFAQIVNKIL